MFRGLWFALFLLSIIPILGSEQIDDFEMFRRARDWYYNRIVNELGLTNTNQVYSRRFSENLKYIHAIVPARMLLKQYDKPMTGIVIADDWLKRFFVVATDDWNRKLIEGSIYSADSIEHCLKAYVWRFATSSKNIDISKLKVTRCWGDLCIVNSNFNELTRTYPYQCGCRIEMFRNGIWISLMVTDDGMKAYPEFLDSLDALLRHDPDKPFVPPASFSESAYRENLKKYREWRHEQRERELAKQRAETERAPAPRRLPAPVFIWTDETAAPCKELMRKWFPDSPETLGAWRGGYAAAPDNPAAAAVTGDSLRQRFPVVQPSSPEYKRGDAFHVSASSRDGKERYAVAVLHGRSAPEAREALAWLCLTGGGGRLRKIGGEPARFKKRPSLAIGDFCVSNQGEVREDGTVAPGSDAREIFFLRGDTAAMVLAEAPGGSAVEVAKWLDKLIAGALEGDGK